MPAAERRDFGEVQLAQRVRDALSRLSQEWMAELFGRERSVVSKHIRNVFKEGELEPEAVRAKFAHTAADGKTYQVDHFNLDVIIPVGYRVTSLRGTRFRIWATRTLREHRLPWLGSLGATDAEPVCRAQYPE